MRYLVVTSDSEPFYTNWFDAENNWVDGMIVFDLNKHLHCTDGKTWIKTKEDQL